MIKRGIGSVAFALSAALSVGACGGNGDTPLADGGSPADSALPDAGLVRPWPAPRDFPPDGTMQSGEGDACRLSVQCIDRRQICVDDACIREERVRVDDLTYGEWEVLTPESTDENPFAIITGGFDFNAGVVLDEDGEVVLVGVGHDAAGNNIAFRVGQDVRLVATPAFAGSALPYQDGFLILDDIAGAAFIGPDGAVQWTAETVHSLRPPYDVGNPGGFFRPLIHTPAGPVLVVVLTAVPLTGVYDIIALQRLDLGTHRFADTDFVTGPFLSNASIGQAVMGPTGLELIIGRAVGDAQPTLSIYSVATGQEQPIGDGVLTWEVGVLPMAANDWVALVDRVPGTAACDTVAFGSDGRELSRSPSPVPVASACDSFRGVRPSSGEPQWISVFLRNESRRAWFIADSSGSGLLESQDGITGDPVPAIGSFAMSRYGKTWELFGQVAGGGTLPPPYAPGVYFAERHLTSGTGAAP